MLGAVAVTLGSCSSDDDIFSAPQDKAEESSVASRIVNVTVGASSAAVKKADKPETRMAVDWDKGLKHQFEKGDTLLAYSADVDAADATVKDGTPDTLFCTSADGSTSTFSGKLRYRKGQSETYYLVGGGLTDGVKFLKSSLDGTDNNPHVELTKMYYDFGGKSTEELSQFMKDHYVYSWGGNTKNDQIHFNLKGTHSFYVSGRLNLDGEGKQTGDCKVFSLVALIGTDVESNDLSGILYKNGWTVDWSKYNSTEFMVNVNSHDWGWAEGFPYRPVINLADGSYDLNQYEYDDPGNQNYRNRGYYTETRYFYNYGVEKPADLSDEALKNPGNKFVLTRDELEKYTENGQHCLILFPVVPGRYEDFAIYASSSTPSDGSAIEYSNACRNEFATATPGNIYDPEKDDYLMILAQPSVDLKNNPYTATDREEDYKHDGKQRVFSSNNIYVFDFSKSEWKGL